MAAIPAPLGPQPDWDAISNAFGFVANQTLLIPNAVNANPNNNVLPLLQQINAQMNQMNAQMNQMNAQVNARFDALDNAIDAIRQELELQPMRIANGTASLDAPLVYPPGTAQAALAALPRIKRDAVRITGAGARNALEQLDLPSHGNARQRRARFLRFIGV